MTYYNKKAKEFFEDTINVDLTNIYNEFLKHIKPKGKILDLGCGSGRDLLYFKNKDYEAYGLDNSEELIKLAEEYTNEKIIKCDFRNINLNIKFDAIWANASLLHLTINELKSTITKLINHLNKNGTIYMSFKYGTFEGIRNDRHFTYFTEKTITSFLNKFENIKTIKIWKTTDQRKDRNNEFWLNVIVRKNKQHLKYRGIIK